jgi:eukaryotic-like serine/threonine-protein kinase
MEPTMECPRVIIHVPLPAREESDFMFDYVFDCPQACVIGQAEDCDIRILNEGREDEISLHHCLLVTDPPRVHIYDLGSANGTYVNGQPLEPGLDLNDVDLPAGLELNAGDEIRIGDTTLHVLVEANVEAMQMA